MTSLVHRLHTFWRFSVPAPTLRRRIAALAETEAVMRAALEESGVRPDEAHPRGGASGWSAALPAGADAAWSWPRRPGGGGSCSPVTTSAGSPRPGSGSRRRSRSGRPPKGRSGRSVPARTRPRR
ncbi:hypothetical protein [Actinomadura sp. 21ATH]|uniref:hypothetical protein n=1 Tax=Actinomadura sp. 21ATH TaxID=1735444 RepID=UPI0035C055DD